MGKPSAAVYTLPNDAAATLAQGARAVGYVTVHSNPRLFDAAQLQHADLVILGGTSDRFRLIGDHYARTFGSMVVSLTAPRLRRVVTPERWFGLVAGSSTHWVPRSSVSGKNRLSLMRPNYRAKYDKMARHILVFGQDCYHENILSSEAALVGWANGVASMIRAVTADPIVWLPHPETRHLRVEGYDEVIDPLAEDLMVSLTACRAVVAHAATTAADALFAGWPVFTTDASADSFWWECARTDIQALADKVERPDKASIADLMGRLSYTQWTLEELRDGTALESTLSCLDGATCL
jgi:hypothetical protein